MGVTSRLSYAIGEIRENWEDRWWWRQRFQRRIASPVQKRFYGNDGIDVMAADWDNLLVLDACRADIFRDVVGTGRFDSYREVTSRGSATPEWLERNFAGRSFGDTVYVSANPWVSKVVPGSFHELRNLWVTEYGVDESALADAYVLKDVGVDLAETIGAGELNRAAIDAAGRFADKRLVVHYMQPHAPYIGNPDGTRKDGDEVDGDLHPGKPLKRGRYGTDEVWAAYRDNLRYVWHHASRLADRLEGKTVVTSDHGELFGERLWPFPVRGYDHPNELRVPPLVRVPWGVLEGRRREITDDGVRRVDVDDRVIEDRLRDLGYTQ